MRKLLLLMMLAKAACGVAQTAGDVQHYRFEVTLSDTTNVIYGRAAIRTKPDAGAGQLAFDLATRDMGKGMYVDSVLVQGSAAHFTQQWGQRLLITLPQGTPAGLLDVEVVYHGIPGDGLVISKNKFGQRTFFSDHWPNRAHNWLPCNDRPDDKASFEFIVTAPSKYRVISNGRLVGEKALSPELKQTHWREETPLSTKIMAIGVAQFAVKQYPERPEGIPVSAWAYPKDSAAIFHDYAVAVDALRFFSGYIAPFPFSKLANVQSTTIFGGMENAGAIFYAENLVSGKRKSEDVVAHEVVHQWFGDMASEKSFAHLWLSEGFATFFTNLYFEKKYGRDSAAARLREERSEVAVFTKTSNHSVVDSTKDLMSLLNANSYQKGGWVLHMLRQEVGDSVFRAIIRTYYAAYRGRNADTRDFLQVTDSVYRAMVPEGKTASFADFFTQWLYRPGIPVLSYSIKGSGDKAKVLIVQEEGIFRFPLEVRVQYADKTNEIITVPVSGRETEIKIKGKTVRSITLDPATKLLFRMR